MHPYGALCTLVCTCRLPSSLTFGGHVSPPGAGAQAHILSEKQILAEADHPFLIQLISTFKDAERLYMVLEYCPGGELFTLLQKRKTLKEEHAVFYAGSVRPAIAPPPR